MPATEDMNAKVILVNKQDKEIGVAEKLLAHQEGLLHRAFSIFVFNHEKELLLQQRADTKYHSGGLWTNTCCSHPNPGEKILDAAARRLQEEFNLIINLHHSGQFYYKSALKNGLIEHELDHVFIGHYNNETLTPNKQEIKAHRWVSIRDLEAEILAHPEYFTAWLGKALSFALNGLINRELPTEL